MDGQATVPLWELDRLRNIEKELLDKAKNPDNVTVFRLDYVGNSCDRVILIGRDDILVRLAKELGEVRKEFSLWREKFPNAK